MVETKNGPTVDKLFTKRTVLISGGLGDIGRATALEFARLGAAIAIGDMNPASQAEALLNELGQLGVATHYTQVDVREADAVQNWVLAVENSLGVADIIIANAAIVTARRIHEITPEQWSNEIRVNLDGAFFMTQSATARLLAHGLPGRVVFVGSWAAHAVHPHIPAYSVAKAGLRMLCQCMALELAPHQILVNEIAPGYVNAGLSAKLWEKEPARAEEARQRVPIRKLISAEAVARQVVYLCHPDNEHMTGSTLLMDGGLSL
ncbi:glucose 1-dehydrogenase [Larkinella arboricola]|uniref:Glucose 1-dehydrogenase n=1 Tax=Larkinella arboricola TaxID=643671 RepID=A0A327XDE8_LARAB|nr:SDR family oxidoreductase [Larkinella arboricola]RAK02286.1 glucose 1-dehydrogenase [Larkinella arboricola]